MIVLITGNKISLSYNATTCFERCSLSSIAFNSLRSCYPESKRSLESLAHCYVIEHKIHANIARLCSICPEVLDLSKDELDVFCHHERTMQLVKLRIFCEMAERGLI